MMTLLLIGLGGAFGALFRYLISQVTFSQNNRFPWATFIVNILGSFLLGIVVYYFKNGTLTPTLWYVLGIGFCGAFTTFSTFGVETITLIEQKRLFTALFYISSSIFISIFAFFIGNTL